MYHIKVMSPAILVCRQVETLSYVLHSASHLSAVSFAGPYCRQQLGLTILYLSVQTHYLTSHPRLNYFAIVPHGETGPDGSGKGWWTEQPEGRDKF